MPPVYTNHDASDVRCILKSSSSLKRNTSVRKTLPTLQALDAVQI